jgi:8-oxo-dGTP pyrophosphatase MutT (NUDIX family)
VGRRAASLIALALGVIVAGAALASVSGSWRYHDFWCFYHGGAAVLRGVDPYEHESWADITADPSRVQSGRLVKDPCPSSFAYPYWTAIAFAPLGLLPYEDAAIVWGALLIGGAIWGVWRLARATNAPPLLLFVLVGGSLSFIEALTFGQIAPVLLPALAVSANGAAVRAGAATAALVLKPQLAAVYAPVIALRAVVRRDGPFVIGLVTVITAFVLISVALRPAWPPEWWNEITTVRLEIARPLPSAWSLAALLTGTAAWGVALIAALLIGVAALARWRVPGALPVAGIAMGISLFVTPHIYSYDHLMLALPWAIVLGVAASAPPAKRLLLLSALVACATVIPWAIFVATFESGTDTWNAVVPALAALLVAVSAPGRSVDRIAPTRVRVIVPRGDRILMVQHRDADGLFWILPGGGVKPGETLEDAAVREVWEEAGARCRIVRRLELPAGVDGMAGYGLFLGAVDTDALEPSQMVDGEVVHAVAWQRISDAEPIGPLTPLLWSPIAPVFKAILGG